MNSKNRFILINLLAFEFVLLNVVLTICFLFKLPDFSLSHTAILPKMLSLIAIYNITWLVIIMYIRNSEFYFNPDFGYFKSIITSLFFFVGFVMSVVILLKIRYFERSTFIVPIFIFSYLNLVSHKYLLRYLKKRAAHLFSDTLLIGSGYDESNIKSFTNAMTQYGYNIMGYLENTEKKPKNVLDFSVFGSIDDLPKALNDNGIDEIFIAMGGMKHEKIMETIRIADSFGVRVKLIPKNPLLKSKNYKAVTMGDLAVFKLRESPLDHFSTTVLKRLFDFCFAFLVLLFLVPVFLIIAIVIKIDSKGPIFYSPLRKGEGGRTFKCYKFRTMHVTEDPINGARSTVVDDPRITRVGKFLRKMDLDELPQFYNVLKGEMSVIGPRPHRVNLQNDFRKSVNHYMVRSYVKPGITGWAQVNGWRGPTVTDEQKNQRVNHDLWYIENWSLWLDVKIIFLTIFGNHHKKAF
ncbi:exopolysaccharide biosynthesis polyprenyl glycosylphosphotransferase [Zobellia galactanivorans]|uniref:Exopolysaccharide production protein n=1 Tax=Zobellia galactanivorans (strain DSM 12802 / CCUG 47099 / CIP 106680 / NCIMB 13871 / Dsij) TaxID=63186 RepID=G0L594_ZOBGA|nr:exopolysaccharide biosynthesis polyprenyl glycosylphosphotransferase [Zobellia galactanivorans]MDO6809961.1 exopolysaccharide biosynthesis polyprenyl glycosylphosphotransferase [Zobellia galactanivorans]CAZ96045.1 Exopolysaccharide production protein [Zobellia galactanivorans]